MKVFVILSVLVAGAMSARLDNTYIPPANAQSAGGYNLETPRAQPSNVQNTYAAPAAGHVQTQYQQQSINQPGLNQGTYTSVSKGNGFQAVSAGSFSGSGNLASRFQKPAYQAPQQPYQAPQQAYQPQPQAYQPQAYQQPQQSYPAQPQYNNYQQNQQSGYNGPSTTPIPILECKKTF